MWLPKSIHLPKLDNVLSVALAKPDAGAGVPKAMRGAFSGQIAPQNRGRMPGCRTMSPDPAFHVAEDADYKQKLGVRPRTFLNPRRALLPSQSPIRSAGPSRVDCAH